jgi:hypothetical protein
MAEQIKNLITIKHFADKYPSVRNGVGVNVGYIYKLISKGRNIEEDWELVIVDGVHFIKENVSVKPKKKKNEKNKV